MDIFQFKRTRYKVNGNAAYQIGKPSQNSKMYPFQILYIHIFRFNCQPHLSFQTSIGEVAIFMLFHGNLRNTESSAFH